MINISMFHIFLYSFSNILNKLTNFNNFFSIKTSLNKNKIKYFHFSIDTHRIYRLCTYIYTHVLEIEILSVVSFNQAKDFHVSPSSLSCFPIFLLRFFFPEIIV